MSLHTAGGFGNRRSTKKYMHLLVDHFTRFAYISTSSTQNAKDFFKLVNLINKGNRIDTLLTDQYGAFTSNEFEKYINGKGINHIITATGNPESHGLNERLNQTIKNRLRCKNNTKNENRAWSTLAQECVNEYNDTVHSITRFSPRYLMEDIAFPLVPKELQNNNVKIEGARKIIVFLYY